MSSVELPLAAADVIERQTVPSFDAPLISVDRTLAHFISEIEIDLEELAGFYEALPHENKLPLSDLPLHYSATPLVNGDVITLGQILWKGTRSQKPTSTPELPVSEGPLIVIYVGSALLELTDKEAVSEQLTNTTKHELTHIAQGDPSAAAEMTRRQKLTNHAIYLGETALLGVVVDRRWAKTGAASFMASEALWGLGDTGGSLKLAAAAAFIAHLIGRKSRQARDAERQHENYLQEEREVEASQIAHDPETPDKIVTVNVSDFDETRLLEITVNKKKNRIFRWASNKVHQKLAVEPVAS